MTHYPKVPSPTPYDIQFSHNTNYTMTNHVFKFSSQAETKCRGSHKNMTTWHNGDEVTVIGHWWRMQLVQQNLNTPQQTN